MADQHKTRISIGEFSFEAEGDKASVDARLARFEALVEKALAAKAGRAQDATANQPNPNPPNQPKLPEPPLAAIPEGDLARVFKEDKGVVSLRVLPKTKAFAADTLLLLLYGYHEIKKQSEVLGGHLMTAARQSGVKLDRVDRVLELHTEYFDKGGARKGARYRLNNPGLEKARELMQLMKT